MSTHSKRSKRTTPQPWTAAFDAMTSQPAQPESGRHETRARVVIDRSRIAAAVRTYTNYPDQPLVDVVMRSPGLDFAGELGIGNAITFNCSNPQALRDLGTALVRLADGAERRGVFEAATSKRSSVS